MAKKAASPKTAKAKDSKANEENNDKELKSPSKATNDSIKKEDSPVSSPNKKRKAESLEGEDQAVNTHNDEEPATVEGEGETTPNDVQNNNELDDGKPAAAEIKLEIDLTKPIKRARTAYFIFSDENRAEVQAKHKGEGVAVLARELGQMWAKMSAEEKCVYQEKSALEREEVAQQLEKLKAAGIDLKTLQGAAKSTDPGPNDAVQIPLSRIRKIVMLDPEVKKMSKEALLLVTRCTELMTSKLGIEAVRVAQIQNRRTLMPDDVANVTQTREQFLFLRDDVKDFVKEQIVQRKKDKETKDANSIKDAKASSDSKPLTSYFSAKSS